MDFRQEGCGGPIGNRLPQPTGEILLLIRCRCSNGQLPNAIGDWVAAALGHEFDRIRPYLWLPRPEAAGAKK
jgi:hypothetical protein